MAALNDCGRSVRLQGASSLAILVKAGSFAHMSRWEDGLDCAEHAERLSRKEGLAERAEKSVALQALCRDKLGMEPVKAGKKD